MDVIIESRPVTVEIDNARGLPGPSGAGASRLLYVAEISRGGNFLGSITVDNVLINNTGKTFTFNGTGTSAIMECDDPTFFNKILNVTYYKKTLDELAYPFSQNENTMDFIVGGSAASFRLCIEFYNY